VDDSHFVRHEANGGGEYFPSIFHAAFETDGGGFLEVFRGSGDFAEVKAEHDGLGDHLVVEA
jgi:hypothetical protein